MLLYDRTQGMPLLIRKPEHIIIGRLHPEILEYIGLLRRIGLRLNQGIPGSIPGIRTGSVKKAGLFHLGILAQVINQTYQIFSVGRLVQLVRNVTGYIRAHLPEVYFVDVRYIKTQWGSIGADIHIQGIHHDPKNGYDQQQLHKYPDIASALVPYYFQYMLNHCLIVLMVYLFSSPSFKDVTICCRATCTAGIPAESKLISRLNSNASKKTAG